MASATTYAGSADRAGSSSAGSLVFLRNHSPALVTELLKRMDPEKPPVEGVPMDIRLTDFEDTHFVLEASGEKPNLVSISMVMPGFKDCASAGAEEQLRAAYGSMMAATPRAGADVTLTLDVSAPLPAGKTAADVATHIASLRRQALGAPFDRALKVLATKGAPSPAPEVVLKTRPKEPVFILPRADRVAVIFAIHFADPTDRAVARIICHEFVEAQRHISTAPPVNYSEKEAPLELRGRPDLIKHGDEPSFVGYLTFSIMPKQVESEAKRANVVNLLQQFRLYLDYHIKAAKSYMHTRMRSKTEQWMQVLNRAVAEDPYASKEKKVMSGKTFVKKV